MAHYIEVELSTREGSKTGSGRHAWLRSPAFRKAAWTGTMVLGWYVLSTALGMYNKVIVGKDKGLFGQGAFPAPLLMSGVQFAFQAMLAKLVFGTGIAKRTAPPMPWPEWSRLVLPNGVITGLDIGLSNKSLVFITMSFYTMCKSTTPIFLLLFAFAWGLEQPSWSLAGVVCVIVTGLLLLVKGETRFDATGFALVMTAACMSGLRFTLTQVLLHGRAGHGQSPFGGPLEVLEALTPIMAATTLLMSLAFERLWAVLPGSPYFSSLARCAASGGVIFFGAIIAFGMVWCEYEVIKDTSALTFMVAGIVKELLTIVAAVAVFGDSFGWINGLGLAIAISGVALFNVYKLRRLRAVEPQEVVLVRRSGAGAGDGEAGAAGGAKDGGVVHPAALLPRAGSRQAGGSGSGTVGGGGGGRGTWRRESGSGGALDRRRHSGSLSASGEDDDGANLEHQPLLLDGGGSGGLSHLHSHHQGGAGSSPRR